MSFLGYDPNRLQALRRALHDLVDEQTGVQCDDPWGREQAMRARNELAKIAGWTVRIDQILDCAFGSPYRPVGTGTGPNHASPYDPAFVGIVRPWDRSWLLTLDPTTAIDTDLEMLAGELGTWLQHTDISNVVDDHERASALIALFNRVAADPAAAEAFADALGPDGLSWLTNRLAGLLTAAPLAAATTPTAGPFQDDAAVFDALAHTVSAALTTGHVDGGALLGSSIGNDTYAAISFVGRLTIPAAQLATLATSIWTRASKLADAERGLEILLPPEAPKTIDLLIAMFSREPQAGRVALTEMSDDAYVALLDQGDGKAVGQMLVKVTKPSVAADEKRSSSAIIGRLLSTLDQYEGLRTPELVGFVGVVAGPWLPELVVVEDPLASYPLTPLDLGGRSPEHVLQWIAANREAAQSLVIWMTALAELDSTRIAGHKQASDAHALVEHSRGPEYEHLGQILGAASAAIRDGRVRAAQHKVGLRRAVWGNLASTVSNVLTASEIFDGPAGLAANLAFGWGAQKIIDAVVGDRLGDGQVDAVRMDQIRKAMSIEVSTVAAVAQATYKHLVASEALPASVPPPPSPTGEQLMTKTENCYLADVVSWRDSLPDAYKRIADEVVVNALAEGRGFNSRMALGERVNGTSSDEAGSTKCSQKTSAGS